MQVIASEPAKVSQIIYTYFMRPFNISRFLNWMKTTDKTRRLSIKEHEKETATSSSLAIMIDKLDSVHVSVLKVMCIFIIS